MSESPPFALAGATALVTGGSAGIGLATARRLHARGAKVVICARGEERLEWAAATIGEERVLAVPADATVVADLERLHATATATFGPVQVLINNVGTALRGPFVDLTDDDWQQDLDIKLLSAIRLSRLMLRDALAAGHGGRIINVLSTGGKHPAAGSAPTSVTRAAGLALTKVLSKEYAAHGVLVNAVCVGVIRSAQHDDRHAEGDGKESIDDFYLRLARQRGAPIGRAGEADEVAAVIEFLASDAGGYVTGTAINVDGGAAPVL